MLLLSSKVINLGVNVTELCHICTNIDLWQKIFCCIYSRCGSIQNKISTLKYRFCQIWLRGIFIEIIIKILYQDI